MAFLCPHPVAWMVSDVLSHNGKNNKPRLAGGVDGPDRVCGKHFRTPVFHYPLKRLKNIIDMLQEAIILAEMGSFFFLQLFPDGVPSIYR